VREDGAGYTGLREDEMRKLLATYFRAQLKPTSYLSWRTYRATSRCRK